ncbi:MAG: LolA family protein [Planctomycetota bacterium]|jgi:hypothetical protein
MGRFLTIVGFTAVLLLGLLLETPVAVFAGEAEKPPAEAGEGGAEKPAKEGENSREGPGPLDEATRTLLERLDKIHKRILALKAPYKQVRKVRISKSLRKAEGVLYIKKGPKKRSMKVLFVETKPFRSRALFTDKEVVFEDGETGEVKRRDPRQGGVKPSEIWVLGRPAAEIVKHYTPKAVPLDVEPEGEKGRSASAEDVGAGASADRGGEGEKYEAKLELVPKSKKIRKWVQRILVWMRKGDALGTRVRIVDKTGDYQEFTFDEKKLEINPELKDDLFEIE